jgi:hypothetical protein
MPEYQFSYYRGRVRATHGVTAGSNGHAFKKMRQFVKMFTVKYIKDSMQIFGQDNRWHFLSKHKELGRSRPATLQAAE